MQLNKGKNKGKHKTVKNRVGVTRTSGTVKAIKSRIKKKITEQNLFGDLGRGTRTWTLSLRFWRPLLYSKKRWYINTILNSIACNITYLLLIGYTKYCRPLYTSSHFSRLTCVTNILFPIVVVGKPAECISAYAWFFPMENISWISLEVNSLFSPVRKIHFSRTCCLTVPIIIPFLSFGTVASCQRRGYDRHNWRFEKLNNSLCDFI